MIAWWSPRLWGAHLLGIVCVAAAIGLGIWQYDAWQARRAAEQVDLTSIEPVPMTDLIGPDQPFPGDQVGRPVTVEGEWIPDATVLVDGRDSAEGEAGSWVVTPLSVDGTGDPAVAVVRGWIAGADPADAPAPPTGSAAFTGWLQPGEGTGVGDDDPTDDVLPQLRIADLIQRVDVDMYGAYVVVDPAATAEQGGQNAGTDDLEPATLDQLPPAGTFTAWRNFAYAIEWWLFAGFAAFVWWRYVRDTVSGGSTASREEAADETAEEPPVDSTT